MTLNLLIDTSVWLDLTKDHRQLPLLDALSAMDEEGAVALIMPQIVIEEFARNRDRVMAASRASLSSHFKRVREAILQFAPEEGRDFTLKQLNDVDHKVATGGEAVNEAVDLIEKLFGKATAVSTSDDIKVRAANRAIAKVAPFHRQMNGIGDAIIIETYIEALAARKDDDVFAFVTHNIHDFSQKGADTRIPHSDLAPVFDGVSSRYETNLSALLNEFAGDLIEETRFEREYSQDPRQFSVLLEAARKLETQVWYNRKWNIIARVEDGEEKLVSKDVWYQASPEERRNLMVDSIWEGMLAAMRNAEEELGVDELGPWTDFEWGMINGKLSAIRWVLGEEWDMLDT